MTKVTSNDFRRGMYIVFRDEPHQVMSFSHSYVGRGSAHMSAKLKNVISGKTIEHTFRAGEPVEEAAIAVSEMQFLYIQADECLFMDMQTYEQYSIKKSVIGTFSKFLKEGEIYQLLKLDDNVINIRPPKKVTLKVTEAPEGARGNTASAATKTVTLENGVSISVPLFIKEGDTVVVNPETGEYVERG